MITINFLVKKTNKRCSKNFYDSRKATRFMYKINKSNDLVLLSIEREICWNENFEFEI